MRASPTRQGWTVLVSAAIAVVIGRLFGILELFVIGAALAVAVLVAWAVVRLWRPKVAVHRWIRPSVLTAGDVGRVEVLVQQIGSTRSPAFELVEPVGPDPHGPHGRRPAARGRRGERRVPHPDRTAGGVDDRAADRDPPRRPRPRPLGRPRSPAPRRCWSRRAPICSTCRRSVRAPSAATCSPSPSASARATSTACATTSTGDEPRSIHWRASARSEELKVRQHSVEGLRRCVVLLDQHVPRDEDGEEAFERAVTAAASVVHSADRAGLTTRFVTTDGADLRGPDVAAQTLHLLARINPSTQPPVAGRTGSRARGSAWWSRSRRPPGTAAWAALERVAEPALTTLGVFTHGVPAAVGRSLAVDARSEAAFLDGWALMAGRRPVGAERRTSRVREPARHAARGQPV